MGGYTSGPGGIRIVLGSMHDPNSDEKRQRWLKHEAYQRRQKEEVEVDVLVLWKDEELWEPIGWLISKDPAKS